MTDLQLDIDAIVREVLRRLNEQMSRGQARADRGMASTEPRDDSCLRIDQRVVTVTVLEGRLNGVKRVSVTTGAVVTPAVRDLLRERQIALVHDSESAAMDPATETLLVGLAAKSPAGDATAVAVAGEVQDMQTVRDECPVAVTRQLMRQIAECDRSGVLLTNEPVAALCAANRRPGVRAAWGVSIAAVEQAVRTMGANLLIIDPAAHSLYELRSMVRHFVRAPREYSDRWKKLLE